MATGAHMRMNTDTPPMRIEAALILSQWFSPAYPVGGFAYSHGLETVVQDGTLRSAAALRVWLEDVLLHGSGRNDAILLGAAWRARSQAETDRIDATARAFAASAERLRESALQGAAFARTTAALTGHDIAAPTYPVAVGRAAGLAGLPLEPTVAMFLQGVMSNLVSTAVRLVPLGQTEGQAVLAHLSPLCARVAAQTAGLTPEDMTSTAFLSDIAAMRHETLTTRLFRS